MVILMNRIGIIGHGITIESRNDDWSVEDTVFYTVKQALKNTGMEIAEIDTVIQAGDDVLDGVAINHVQTVEAAGSFLKEESKVERDGAWGLHYGMARLLSGKFRTGMIVAFSKGSQCGLSAFSGLSADPFYLRPVGADSHTVAGLQASYFLQRSGLSEEDIALTARKNRLSGKNNPRVLKEAGGDFSVEQILKSKPIATPIRELNSGKTADGCVVLIIATDDWIKEHKKNAAFITGTSFISDAYYPTYRDFSRLKSAEIASAKALSMAKLKPEEINVAEVHSVYAHQELMLLESAGFCRENETGKLLREGVFGPDGKLPVNPSGGAVCGNIIYGAGLARVMEVYLQLTGNAGAVQLKGASRGFAHSQAGLGMQANIAFVLEN